MHLLSVAGALVLTASLGRCASQIPLTDFRDSFTQKGRVVDEELSAYIQTQLDEENIAGMSMAVVLPDGRVEYETWGKRTEEGDPVTSDTVFNLASCSKAFLSASLGILMQDFADGKNNTPLPDSVAEFTWSTKIHHLLPDGWMVEDPWTNEKANLQDLLSHQTGLPSHDGSYSPDDSPRDVILKMRHLRAAYELRERYEYNNQMYMTGAYVVSKYSGQSYRDFVEERILKPLGMTSSTLYPDRAHATGRFTQSWSPLTGRRIPFFMPEHTADLMAGAAGVMSTAEDVTRWVKMLLQNGVDGPSNATIIPRATFDQATSGISLAFPTGDNLTSLMGYGLGWGRLSYRGHDLFRHSGGAPGVSTRVHVYPHDGFATILLANTASPTSMQHIAYAVVDRVLGLPRHDQQLELEEEEKLPQTRSQTQGVASEHGDPWPPEMPFVNYAGTYANPGYGNFTLCSPLFLTQECLPVILEFGTVDEAADKGSWNFVELYARWPRFWGTHMRLSPVPEDSAYTVQLTNLFPSGYGTDHTPFEDSALGQYIAKFVVDEGGDVVGVGFFGVAQSVSWRAQKGGSVRDTADVWFDKI